MLLFTGAIGCLLLCGCLGSDASRGAVSGLVRVDEWPLAQGSIEFFPIEGTKGPSTGGSIHDGRYEIAREKGPAVGRNRVEIRAFQSSGKRLPDMKRPGEVIDELVPLLPAACNDRSELTCEIRPGDNRLDFELSEN